MDLSQRPVEIFFMVVTTIDDASQGVHAMGAPMTLTLFSMSMTTRTRKCSCVEVWLARFVTAQYIWL